jgi:hypothetical protein
MPVLRMLFSSTVKTYYQLVKAMNFMDLIGCDHSFIRVLLILLEKCLRIFGSEKNQPLPSLLQNCATKIQNIFIFPKSQISLVGAVYKSF